jgi:regulator of sigma E protease
MTILLSIIIGIIALGLMVIIHELGHFGAAKACGIRVLAFSVGFGKVLLKKNINGTEYRLSAIPCGGYVKMAGEQPEDERTGAPDEFHMRPKWQRAFVAIAGPLANYLTGMIMLWAMFMWGVKYPSYYGRPIIGAVSDSSAAKDAGITIGDSIVTINNKSIKSWEDMENVFSTPSKKYEIAFIRDGKTYEITLNTDQKKGDNYKYPPYGMEYPIPAVIGQLNENMPAIEAGLKKGDTVLAIDNQKISYWSQLSGLVQKGNDGKSLLLLIARGTTHLTIPITPKYDQKLKRLLVGIGPGWEKMRTVRYTPKVAWYKCVDKTWDYTVSIFIVLGKLIKKELSWTLISGPVGIIPMSGFMALQGLSYLLKLMGMISINLAVINLFPLIITDGGVLLFLLIETIRRKPLSIKAQMAITQAGIMFFIALFVLITYNDLMHLPQYFKLFLK